GYASLTYLHKYPIDLLKVDQSFVTNMNTEDKDRKIIAATIALAAVLEMAVTAEGVETSEQAELLGTMGCKSVQGWLYSKALPHDDITPLLDHSYSTPDGAENG
ncbi:MAG: EAL domain-containing protein, partial [Actinomycetota bacterium]|nr:EAL domain-containing protein [Actinomycetota bacterium]